MHLRLNVVAALLATAPVIYSQAIITTVAGSGTAAFSGDGGAATQAALDTPAAIARGSRRKPVHLRLAE
jgi:hypothetical protein